MLGMAWRGLLHPLDMTLGYSFKKGKRRTGLPGSYMRGLSLADWLCCPPASSHLPTTLAVPPISPCPPLAHTENDAVAEALSARELVSWELRSDSRCQPEGGGNHSALVFEGS